MAWRRAAPIAAAPWWSARAPCHRLQPGAGARGVARHRRARRRRGADRDRQPAVVGAGLVAVEDGAAVSSTARPTARLDRDAAARPLPDRGGPRRPPSVAGWVSIPRVAAAACANGRRSTATRIRIGVPNLTSLSRVGRGEGCRTRWIRHLRVASRLQHNGADMRPAGSPRPASAPWPAAVSRGTINERPSAGSVDRGPGPTRLADHARGRDRRPRRRRRDRAVAVHAVRHHGVALLQVRARHDDPGYHGIYLHEYLVPERALGGTRR